MKRIILGLVALSLIVAAGMAGGTILERNRYVRQMELLRSALRDARFSVDSCRMSLAQEEQSFRLFDRMVDSLHGQVLAFEDAASGGVPEAQYPEYLEVFDRYNDSVALWEGRAEALQTTEAACRAFVVEHNALSDSLRGRLENREGAG